MLQSPQASSSGVPFYRAVVANIWLWTLPISLSLLLLWPTLLPRYQLMGGVSWEILMSNGLRAAFNQALLHGEFPIWNEWAESGKVFLVLGVSPLNLFTPFELLFDPQLHKTTYAVETVIAYAGCAAMALWLCRKVQLHWAVGALAFLAYATFSVVPWYNQQVSFVPTYVFGAALVVLLTLHVASAEQRWLVPALVCAALFVTGGRPDAVSTYLIFASIIIAIAFFSEILRTGRRHAFICVVQRLGAFVVVPLGLYAWQLALVGALVRVSTTRLWSLPPDWGIALFHLKVALGISYGLKLAILWFGIALGLQIFTWGGAKRSLALPKAVVGAVLVGAVLVGMHRYWIAELPDRAFALSCILLLAFVVAGRFEDFFGLPLCAAALSFATSDWGVTFGAALEKNAALVDGLPVAYSYVALFFIANGMLVGFRKVDSGLKTRLAPWLTASLVVAWLCRDFLALPLEDLGNFIWPRGRDFLVYVPAACVLFAIGVDTFLKEWVAPLASRFWLAKVATILGGALLLADIGANFVWFLYVPPGDKVPREMWTHLTGQERADRNDRLVEVAQIYAQINAQANGSRVLGTNSFGDIGLPGSAAGWGMHEAWAYDYVSDVYRELAERAFHTHDDFKTLSLNYPRLMYYNSFAGLVYRTTAITYEADIGRFFLPGESMEAFNVRFQKTYTRLQAVSSSANIDPFFLELMRVGGILTGEEPVDKEHLSAIDPERTTSLWGRTVAYRFQPERSLRKFGFLPVANGDWAASRALLESDERDELEIAYHRLTLSQSDDAQSGVEIEEGPRSANHLTFHVTADRPGFLVLFDTWHPDWRVHVNGMPAPLERAFIAMRAVPIETGQNLVDFDFVPQGWRLAVFASVLTGIAAIVWATIILRR